MSKPIINWLIFLFFFGVFSYKKAGAELKRENSRSIKSKLHSKRAVTEEKIRKLEREGRAGVRYTATIPDILFLIVGLVCDVGWLIQLIAGIRYFVRYRFHAGNGALCFFDMLSLLALAVVVFGVAVTIYLNKIHEKEIATRLQKNLSFGAMIFGGLAAGIIGIVQLAMVQSFNSGELLNLIWITVGGFLNFAFGLPIFASFKKGIRYSEKQN